jgi:hypothetical protein
LPLGNDFLPFVETSTHSCSRHAANLAELPIARFEAGRRVFTWVRAWFAADVGWCQQWPLCGVISRPTKRPPTPAISAWPAAITGLPPERTACDISTPRTVWGEIMSSPPSVTTHLIVPSFSAALNAGLLARIGVAPTRLALANSLVSLSGSWLGNAFAALREPYSPPSTRQRLKKPANHLCAE